MKENDNLSIIDVIDNQEDLISKLDNEEFALLDELLLEDLEKMTSDADILEWKKNKSIYHYTSPDGLRSIISKSSLWFTHYKFLNDKSEKFYTFEIFKNSMEENRDNLKNNFYNAIMNNISDKGTFNYEIFNNKIKNLPDRFVASFSLNGNSLNLWNYYTKMSNMTGYNIKFKSNELINALKNKHFNWCKVCYDKEKQKNVIRDYIYAYNNKWDDTRSSGFLKCLQDLLIETIDALSLEFKHYAFSSEEEYRIIYKIDSTNREIFEDDEILKCRERNGIIIPYIDVAFDNTCIKGITISPTQQEKLAKEGIENMLSIMGLNHIKRKDITFSDIPVRN